MPRASAAALSGSGFGPASGGQTAAAILSPAFSRPRSTSSANAACPTRRMRMACSRSQVCGEELLQALPGILRRVGAVGVALVAEEAVPGPRVHHHLGLLAMALECCLQLLDGGERDEAVLRAEERQDRRPESFGLVDRDAAPVEGSARLELVGQLARREVAHPAPHAEPRD